MSTQTRSLPRILALPTRQSIDDAGERVRRARAAVRSARTKATEKARAAATRLSTNLSRTAFVGIILLPLVNINPPAQTDVSPAAYRRHHYIPNIRTRSVHTEPIPTPSGTAPPEAAVKENINADTHVDVKRDRRGRISDPEKQAFERVADPKQERQIAAADPEKPAQPIKAAEKDKPAPPPPIPPSQQPAAPWTDEQITAANKECDRLLANVTLVAVAEPPEREGICGAPAPRTLKNLGQSHVAIEPPQMLNCKMIAGLNTWLSDKLQPAAQKRFGSPITRILGAASYSCRNRYGLAKAPISEHAFMNALDISGFALANGRVIKVSHDWKAPRTETIVASATVPAAGDKQKTLTIAASKLGAAHPQPTASPNGKAAVTGAKPLDPAVSKKTEDAQTASMFLHEVHDEACDIFGTVLGPDANESHHDHFHLDMKQRTYHSICQ